MGCKWVYSVKYTDGYWKDDTQISGDMEHSNIWREFFRNTCSNGFDFPRFEMDAPDSVR